MKGLALVLAILGGWLLWPSPSIPVLWGPNGPQCLGHPKLVVESCGPDGTWRSLEGSLGVQGAQDPRNQEILRLSLPGFQSTHTKRQEILGGIARMQPVWRPWRGLGLLAMASLAFFRLPKRREVESEAEPARTDQSTSGSPARPQIGPYRVLYTLGQGATSTVYLAEDGHGSRVALKLLSSEACSDRGFRSRFEREAELCKKMQHPRLVKTYGWGMHLSRTPESAVENSGGGQLWMAQQYIAGQTLSSWVSPRGLHPTQVRRLLVQICEGLEYAHSLGIFHRDLKPDNIFTDSKGQLLIGDFGMARSSDQQTITQEGSVLGTPTYMAPEQVEGLKVGDGRADLYSLGVIGYELLSGQPPFQGSMIEVLSAHLSRTPKPILEVKPKTPVPLAQFISRLLEKNPKNRYASASEALLVLRSLGSSPTNS